MSSPSANTGVSILDLPNILTLLFERAGRPLLPGAVSTPGLFVRYLRRKPARGLAVIYAVDEVGHPKSEHARDPHRSVSLTLDEQALDGAVIQFSEAQARATALEVQPTGVLVSGAAHVRLHGGKLRPPRGTCRPGADTAAGRPACP